MTYVGKTSPEADEEIINIWRHIAHSSQDIETADRLVNEIFTFFRRYLSEFPEMGSRRDHIQSGIRFFPIGNFGIYYFFNNEEVLVVHVLNTLQNI